MGVFGHSPGAYSNQMTHSHQLAAALLAVLSFGCASYEDSPKLHTERRAVGALGPGFVEGVPAPESTIRPKPGSWDAVRPPSGYHVVLLTSGDDAATAALVAGVREWATSENVRLDTVAAPLVFGHIDAIVDAMELAPDLIICAGNALVDALALVTASHLDQQFLVLGAQLPEPTVNVTAAIWPGASSRGSEVPNPASAFDQRAFTPHQVSAAIRAGVASVLSDLTGIVISLE